MTCELSKEQLIGYFYQDMEPSEKEIVEMHLAQCSACKSELEGLAKTTKVFRVWPDEEPQMNLVFEQEKVPFWKSLLPDWLYNTVWRRFAVGFAAGTAAVLVLMALLNFEATYSQGNFRVKLGLMPKSTDEPDSPQTPLLKPVTHQEFAEWQQQSMLHVQEMLQASEERQRRELGSVLTQFVRDLDLQRRQDLHLVQKGFEVFQWSNEDRFRRTDELLNRLLTVTAISSPDSDRQK